jgi:hypothetical protein
MALLCAGHADDACNSGVPGGQGADPGFAAAMNTVPG